MTTIQQNEGYYRHVIIRNRNPPIQNKTRTQILQFVETHGHLNQQQKKMVAVIGSIPCLFFFWVRLKPHNHTAISFVRENSCMRMWMRFSVSLNTKLSVSLLHHIIVWFWLLKRSLAFHISPRTKSKMNKLSSKRKKSPFSVRLIACIFLFQSSRSETGVHCTHIFIHFVSIGVSVNYFHHFMRLIITPIFSFHFILWTLDHECQ